MNAAQHVHAQLRRRLHVDIETYSEAELKKCGVYKYAEHESTEVLCVVFRMNREAPVLWVPGGLPEDVEKLVLARQPSVVIWEAFTPPPWVVEHIETGGEVAAHNAQFERVVLNERAGEAIDFPHLSIEQMICTAAKARSHGLPGALGDAAAALGTHRKDDSARSIMLALCRPRTGKDKRWTFAEAPEKFAHLYAYCVDDVLAESDLDEKLPDLPASELDVWRLDQYINDRGVLVDVPTINIIQALIEQYRAELEKECRRITGGTYDEWDDTYTGGLAPTQREKIATWVREHGYPQLVDMTADTVRNVVKDPAAPDAVKTLLRIYSTYGMKAVSKYQTMLDAMCADERIRGMFLYYGAGTGRWSSLIVQLQNLFRPVIKDCDKAIETMASGLKALREMFPGIDPMKAIASCIRGMLVPKPGHVLQAIDFAGVESRILAWLFGEEWKLDLFRKVDADENEPDNYEAAYAMCFNLDPRDITKEQRQVGKPIDLALGYEGGVGAFVTMAPAYQVDLNELAASRVNMPREALDYAQWMWDNWEVAKKKNSSGLSYDVYTAIEAIKNRWREGHPATVQGWKDILEAAKRAVRDPGTVYMLPNKKIRFKVEGDWLKMRLPSGRKLAYYKPELHSKETKIAQKIRLERLAATGDPQYLEPELKFLDLTYLGMDTETRQWRRTGTYGGKLTENAVQAIAGDLLRGAMKRLERAGYKIVMTIHDEIVSEIPEDFGSLEEAIKVMLDPEPWALDLPLNAEGFRAKRFRK